MNANQKGTALVGGALTDEVMESTHSVLTPGMYGAGQKGLQQFYSPPEAARLALKVIGDTISVLDPTAGDGSLLSEFNPTRSFGVEIDADQIKAAEGGYNAIRGDFQHVYTLLRLGMSGWGGIVANPPFGLQWSDPTLRDGKQTNSTVLTLMMVNRLLAENGQFMFICGAGRHERQLTQLPDYSTVYAVIECDELFEGTREPCAILFGLHDSIRSLETPGVLGTRNFPLDMLDLAAEWVIGLRGQALDTYGSVATSEYASYQRPEQFQNIQVEYNRRVEKRIKTREFDAQLYNGDHIQWYPSAFAKQALQQAGLLNDFHGLNGQPVAYFAQNERLWFKLGAAEERGLVTVDPKLRIAIASVLGDIHKHRVPLYAVKPQQRLGFLDDIDSLVCTKDDPERRFKAGEIYRLNTTTKTLVEKTQRQVESRKNPGEYSLKDFEKHKKVMALTLSGGGANYTIIDGGDNASQDISWLINHFEIPDPGELSTRHPKEIAALEALVREVLDEFLVNSTEWEKTNPVKKPFTIRDFQVGDIARMLFKGFGICAWEQGLGKTVGSLAFYRAAIKLNAKEKLLIVCPGDLKDQWTREAERFLGITPTVIGEAGKRTFSWEPDADGKLKKKNTTLSGHGQAKKIAGDLKRGGTGIFIVHYEAMAVNGTRRGKKLPVTTVKEWDEQRLVRGTDKYGYWYWHRESDNTIFGRNTTDEELMAAGVQLEDGTHFIGRPDDETMRVLTEAGFVQTSTRSYYIEGSRTEGDNGSVSGGKYAIHGYVRPRWETITKKLTSNDICPECQADTRNGWNGTFCENEDANGAKCGYAHFAVKMKPVASLLSTAFHDGVVVLDEITFIQKGTSKRTKALTGIQGRYRLGLSGTPIKNYVNQIFWPLAWTLGYDRPWFPYGHAGGEMRFENDFCVVEFQKDGRRKNQRKVLPDVTNLSRFWRMLASHNVRRRQEETGEELVDIYYHEVKVPLGLGQAEQTKEWLKKLPNGFPAFFAEKYPEHNVVKAGMHEMLAPLLGLNWKLDYACTIPQADEDHEWTGVEVSNYTPANLRALELTMALVKQGRKVLVGSHLVPEGQFLAERLVEKGVKAVHIVDDYGTTINAKSRGERVYEFQTDPDVQVFCAGMKAIRLGHNLDAANAVVLNGLDFDYETLDQFVKRVRRLTSTEDVDVYVMLPTLTDQHTITSRKWQILNLKGNAADLALDGRLILKNEQEISEQEMVRELQERGLTITDDAIEEAEILKAWEATPMLDEFEGEALIPPRPEKVKEEEVPEPEPGDQLSLATPIPDVVPDELALEQNAAEFDAIDAAEAELAELEEPIYVENEDDTYLGSIEEQEALENEIEDIEAPDTNFPDSSSLDFIPFAGDAETVEAIHTELTEPEATASADDASLAEPVMSQSGEGLPLPLATPDEGGQQEIVEVEGPEPDTHDTPAPSLDYMGQLKQAKELLDLGVLDDTEFAELKADLLAGLRRVA